MVHGLDCHGFIPQEINTLNVDSFELVFISKFIFRQLIFLIKTDFREYHKDILGVNLGGISGASAGPGGRSRMHSDDSLVIQGMSTLDPQHSCLRLTAKVSEHQPFS